MSATTARPTPRPAAESAAETQVAVGSKVVGEISGRTALRVDGEVEGKLDLDSEVVIGPSGMVRGEIRARQVKVIGKVIGNVRGIESVAILSEGSLEGDVVSPRMSIAEGAFFKGKVEMNGEPEPPRRPASPAPPATTRPGSPHSPGLPKSRE